MFKDEKISKFILENKIEIENIKPFCKHFEKCGGCIFQNISYKTEKEIKLKIAEKNLNFINNLKLTFFESKKRIYYRNRMDYSIVKKDNDILIGLKEYGKWYEVVNLDECYLLSEETSEILKRTKDFIIKNNLEAYDLINKTGNVRYIVIREGKNTKKRLISIIVKESFPIEKYSEEMKDLANSFVLAINDTLADVSFGRIEKYIGETFSEKVLDKEFIIPPFSFFQSNTEMAEIMIKEAKEFLDGKSLADLYCGVGFFGISFAENFEEIIGIEIDKEAIKAAKLNSIINGIKNANFIEAKVEDKIKDIKSDFIVVDPPRAGLSNRVIKGIISNKNIKKILYYSCNIETFARDLKKLSKNFKIHENIKIFDQFPLTKHFELLAFLERKE
ncbi:MAG: 23S rRNA (uracil(1939)-C(5))-methyltransferase RlmD [Candidatus Aenigmatarchaeota archaeon]